MKILDQQHHGGRLGERGQRTREYLGGPHHGGVADVDERPQALENFEHRGVRRSALGEVEAGADQHLGVGRPGPGRPAR